MNFHHRRPFERPLLIIAPTLFETHRCAIDAGIDPATMVNVRAVTRAYALRGLRAGTAFLSWNRSSWGGTREGYELDQMVTHYQRIGRLRPAGADDIAAACGEGVASCGR